MKPVIPDLGAVAVLGLSAMVPMPATARDWPDRAVDMGVAHDAGGGTDPIAHQLAELLQVYLASLTSFVTKRVQEAQSVPPHSDARKCDPLDLAFAGPTLQEQSCSFAICWGEKALPRSLRTSHPNSTVWTGACA